jgi:hypothetical protein
MRLFKNDQPTLLDRLVLFAILSVGVVGLVLVMGVLVDLLGETLALTLGTVVGIGFFIYMDHRSNKKRYPKDD